MKQVHVINLTLTSDYRLVDSSEKILQNYKVLGKTVISDNAIDNKASHDIMKGKPIIIHEKEQTHMKDNKSVRMNIFSSEYSTRLVFALAQYFSITVNDVLRVFDEINYWNIINDDETCCLLAHDGIKANIKELEGAFNEILSRH